MRISFLFISLFFTFNVNAQFFGNADRYDVTIKQIDVCENATITNETNFTTSGCVTLGSSDFTVDIDVNSALSNNAEDDPRKTVFN